MRIIELFAVPKGKKVTERMFARVLISSICGILLCMACLVGTTWAWFAVSVENTGNVIGIADLKVKVSIRQGENENIKQDSGGYPLEAGKSCSIEATVTGGAENGGLSGDSIAPAYVIMTVTSETNTKSYYRRGRLSVEDMKVAKDAVASFAVSWTLPAGATLLESGMLNIDDGTTEAAEATENTEPILFYFHMYKTYNDNCSF